MKFTATLSTALVLAATFAANPVRAEDSTPGLTTEDKEAFYTQVIEGRVEAIMKALAIADTAKAARVHDAIILQYRSLRIRDAALTAKAKGAATTDSRATAVNISKPLHEWFVSVLSLDLTAEQLELVKDHMTYNKVKVTFTAYCDIVPGLTEKDKAKILELLKAAREEAMDGGSATEKSAVFQKFKDQINEYLNANGHDVAKAYKDWEAKLPPKKDESAATPATPAAK